MQTLSRLKPRSTSTPLYGSRKGPSYCASLLSQVHEDIYTDELAFARKYIASASFTQSVYFLGLYGLPASVQILVFLFLLFYFIFVLHLF